MAHRHSSTQNQHFSIDFRTQVSLYFFTDGTLVQHMSLSSEHRAPHSNRNNTVICNINMKLKKYTDNNKTQKNICMQDLTKKVQMVLKLKYLLFG